MKEFPSFLHLLISNPGFILKTTQNLFTSICLQQPLQCFDAVALAAGRASGLYKLTGKVLAWLSVWSKVQMICIWSSWCHCHPIISCSSKIQNSLPLWCRLTWLQQPLAANPVPPSHFHLRQNKCLWEGSGKLIRITARHITKPNNEIYPHILNGRPQIQNNLLRLMERQLVLVHHGQQSSQIYDLLAHYKITYPHVCK